MFGTNDMKSAYRQLPNRPAEFTGLVIAFWDADAADVRHAILNAHQFGLTEAVFNFNRLPALGTAALRRIFGACSTHFFDDVGIMDVAGA